MKKYVMLALIGIMVLIPMIVNAAFPDVPSGHWAATYINDLTNKKVINGYTDGTFKPNNTLTKGEFLKLIMSASLPGMDLTIVKEDFNHWAADYVKVAENYNVLEAGAITKENIDQPINRIDVIKILSLADINIRGKEQKSVKVLTFSDISDVTVAEKTMLSHAVAKGIINGYPDGTFRPNNNLTRAEVSKIINIYMNAN